MYALAEMLTRCHVLMAQLLAVRLLLARRAAQFVGTDAPAQLAQARAELERALDPAGAAGAVPAVHGAVPSEDVDHVAVPAELPDDAVLPWLRRRLQLAARAARRVGTAAEALRVAAR
jgi:hypothetical protein